MSHSHVETLCAAFPGKLSVLSADLTGGEVCYSHQPEAKLPAGPVIALPLLVCALEQVCRGRLTLEQPLAGQGTLEQGLSSLAAGDPHALEDITELVTPQRADEYFQGTLGLRDTACGPQARTSNQSMYYLLRRLNRGEVLTQPLLTPCAPAPARVGLLAQGEGMCHWVGITGCPSRLRYVGVFSWEGPSGPAQRQAVEALALALAGEEG